MSSAVNFVADSKILPQSDENDASLKDLNSINDALPEAGGGGGGGFPDEVKDFSASTKSAKKKKKDKEQQDKKEKSKRDKKNAISYLEQSRISFAKTISFKVFVFIATFLAIAEPVVIAFYPVNTINLGSRTVTTRNNVTTYSYSNAAASNTIQSNSIATGSGQLQILVLVLSTLWYFIGILASMVFMEPREDEEVALTWPRRFIKSFDGQVAIESACLLYGWITIIIVPGIAVLRCFRVFRMLWYFDLFKDTTPNTTSQIITPLKILHLALFYCKELISELVSAKSRGGLVVLIMFFFVTYVFALVFWIEGNQLVTPDGQTCDTLSHCYLTLFRLAMYDGVGFDFLQYTVDKDPGLGVLLFLYIIITAVILCNGLIGIFGSCFVGAREDVLLEQEFLAREELKRSQREEKERLKEEMRQKTKNTSKTSEECVDELKPILSALRNVLLDVRKLQEDLILLKQREPKPSDAAEKKAKVMLK